MKLDFTGKVAVITGSSEGIGYAAAKVFGLAGAKVCICARRQEKLDEAAASLRELGIDVFAETCDVGSREQMLAFADHCEEHFGRIDILVNNAGISSASGPIHVADMTEEYIDKMTAINIKSICWGAQIAKNKIAKHGGVMINASSFAAGMPLVGIGYYSATKAAVDILTRTLASELAPYNIRVCAYAPGLIDTPMNKEFLERSIDSLLPPISLRRPGKDEEVANAIAFLASDQASFITGITLNIDGGKYATQNPSVAWANKE